METPTIREEEMEDYEDEAGSVVESQGSASPSSGGLPNRSIRPVTTVRNRLIRPVCRECKRLNLKCNLRTPCDKCMEWKRDCKYDPGALTKVDVQSVYDTKIPHQSPVSEYIQAPSSTREPDMLELTLPEWDPSRNEWIYRVSPTEIMSSRSEYRINPNQISFLEGSRFRGGVAEVVPANILDNQNFTGVVLAVKKFLFSGVGDNYSVLSLEPKNRPSATSCMEIVSRMPRVVPTQRDATKPSPHLLRVTGDMYISASQISDGLKYITSALEIARANGDSIETALSLLSLGRAYCIKCESPEAEEAFKEAICGLARLYKRRGKFSEAEALYTEAQRIHAGAGNQPGVAEATSGLADIQRITCRFDAAESTYLEVADLFGRLGDNLGIARAKCGLGDIYRQKNTHGMGEDLYREARDIVIEFGDSRELANTLYGMGHAHCLQGRSTEAASCFQEAEDIHIRIGNRVGVAEVYCGKGDLYRVQGEQDNAEATYRKARELYDEVNHHLGAADAMCGLAHIRRIQGRDREAETLFNQAEGIYKEREYGMGVANAALGVAAVYIERLEYEKAFSTITEALEFYTQAAILPLKASALMMLALTHELQEQSNKSELRIKEALAIYSAVGDESGVLACQELLHGFRDSSGTAAD
ncbi:hypothetical protein M407DRAFT_221298 [Tulasnella calospora MUT 4182]|uniref:Zn(2)-C6 fungal-type domain-containing protein n=1 Tax=Tulasnella calospora MUT 4182 TaxID=1051891 RepID=A0A0C3PY57_9AGAM|nr:hypothetical protein M407DRAFT_221298 [Tulasnella calospora MUT 4182]